MLRQLFITHVDMGGTMLGSILYQSSILSMVLIRILRDSTYRRLEDHGLSVTVSSRTGVKSEGIVVVIEIVARCLRTTVRFVIPSFVVSRSETEFRSYHKYDSDSTPLDTVVALLLLSSKYDFKDIRTNTILQISRQFPIKH